MSVDVHTCTLWTSVPDFLICIYLWKKSLCSEISQLSWIFSLKHNPVFRWETLVLRATSSMVPFSWVEFTTFPTLKDCEWSSIYWVEPVFFDWETSPTDPGDVIPATMSLCRITTNLHCGFSFCLLGYLYLTEYSECQCFIYFVFTSLFWEAYFLETLPVFPNFICRRCSESCRIRQWKN